MADAFACYPPDRIPLDGPAITVYAGDAVVLPLTWWQIAPVYGADGVTVVTPGVPVDMTGMQPSAEFLPTGATSGMQLPVTGFVPASGAFTVTAPGRGQPGDLTSGLPAGPARSTGPRVRVHWRDAAGNPHTFGTFYLAVR